MKYFLIITFLFLPIVVSAQLTGFNNVQLKISPQNPAPGNTVTVKASGTSFDVNRSSFSWSVNGVPFPGGRGVGKVSFVAGSVGSRHNVSVFITTEKRVSISDSVTIVPTDVEILWEGTTNTPLFYKGKALHTAGSEVRAVVISNIIEKGRRFSPSELTYTWSRGSKVLGSLSGRGKSTITIENSGVLRDLDIRVEVSSPSNLVRGFDRVIIPVSDPEIYLYEDDPVLGLRYERALKNFNLINEELTTVAAPFFFSSGSFSYEWKVNGRKVEEKGEKLTLRPEGEGEGLATVSVVAQHLTAFLQKAEQVFRISFGKVEQKESFFNF